MDVTNTLLILLHKAAVSFELNLLDAKRNVLHKLHLVYNQRIQAWIQLYHTNVTNNETPQDYQRYSNSLLLQLLLEKQSNIDYINRKYQSYLNLFYTNIQITMHFILHNQLQHQQIHTDVQREQSTSHKIPNLKLEPASDSQLSKYRKYSSVNSRIKIELITPKEPFEIPQRPRGKGIQYKELYSKIKHKKKSVYRCKICKSKGIKYQVKCVASISKHLRTKHSKQARKEKLKFMISTRNCIPNFDFIIQKHPDKNCKKTNINTNTNTNTKSSLSRDRSGHCGNYKAKDLIGHWKCKTCNAILTTKSGAICHYEIHLGIKRFECDLCDYKCSQRSNLVRHKLTHTDERPEQCNLCGKRFRDVRILRNHIRTHTGEKPYKCHFKGCNRAYRCRTGLVRHFRSHTKEKPFICNVNGCGKAYQTASGLKYHINKHFGINMVECDLCGKFFADKMALSSHKKNIHKTYDHLPVECDLCGKRVKSKWGLKIHKAQVHEIHTYLDYDESKTLQAIN